MTKDIQNLIKTFHLDEFVEVKVKEKIKEIVKDKNKFSFCGSNRTDMCGIQEPHAPHTITQYNTVRYGCLDKFCLGKEGATPEGYIHIIIESQISGSPEFPAKARGFWFIVPVHRA